MNIEKDYIKLIFGLKLKQARTNKNLSLFGLAKITDLSKSYLNEIEKGKKYRSIDHRIDKRTTNLYMKWNSFDCSSTYSLGDFQKFGRV